MKCVSHAEADELISLADEYAKESAADDIDFKAFLKENGVE